MPRAVASLGCARCRLQGTIPLSVGSQKIPNYLFTTKEPLLGFAGLYEFWPDPALTEDDPELWLLTCTVLTTTTQGALGHVRGCSRVIIPKDRFAEWLDPA